MNNYEFPLVDSPYSSDEYINTPTTISGEDLRDPELYNYSSSEDINRIEFDDSFV